MKSRRTRKLRFREKILTEINFAKSVTALAKAVAGKNEKQHRPAGHHWSEIKRKKKLAERLYQRFLAGKERAEQAVQQQCNELLLRYREKIR